MSQHFEWLTSDLSELIASLCLFYFWWHHYFSLLCFFLTQKFIFVFIFFVYSFTVLPAAVTVLVSFFKKNGIISSYFYCLSNKNIGEIRWSFFFCWKSKRFCTKRCQTQRHNMTSWRHFILKTCSQYVGFSICFDTVL